MEATPTPTLPPSKPAIESIGELADMMLRLLRVWAATDPDVPAAVKNEILKKDSGESHG